jgi:hypothetical protein
MFFVEFFFYSENSPENTTGREEREESDAERKAGGI